MKNHQGNVVSPNLRFLSWKLQRRFRLGSNQIAELLSDGQCFKNGKRYVLELPAKLAPTRRLTVDDIDKAFTIIEETSCSTIMRYSQFHPFEVANAGDTRRLKIKEDYALLMKEDRLFGEDLPPDEKLEYHRRRANHYLQKFYPNPD